MSVYTADTRERHVSLRKIAEDESAGAESLVKKPNSVFHFRFHRPARGFAC
jgi:hypothetical protein